MATAYLSPKVAAGVQPRVLQYGVEVSQISTFALTAAFVLNDTVAMMNLASDTSILANGPTITSVVLDAPALDTSTGIVTAVGDATVPGRFIAGATVGRSSTGGIQFMNVAGTIGYQPFAAAFNTYTTVSYQLYTILFKVTTAPTTGTTTGNLTLKVTYTYDP